MNSPLGSSAKAGVKRTEQKPASESSASIAVVEQQRPSVTLLNRADYAATTIVANDARLSGPRLARPAVPSPSLST